MFVFTYSYSCCKVGLPPSVAFWEKQNLVYHCLSCRGGVAKIKGPGKACRKGAHDSLKSLSEN